MAEVTSAADYSKIQAGATMYLEVQRDRPDMTEEFIDCLRSKLGWSPSDIAALRTRVADILLERDRQADTQRLLDSLLARPLVATGSGSGFVG